MAINLTNADEALKSYYLDAVSEQLNENANPFLSIIKKTSDNVWGKEVKQLAIHGINGGIGAGTEDGNLPTARGNHYVQFTSTLKNLYGTIEISDKALKAAENNSGAFVSLLNSEMDGLLKASAFNFGRMLFGDGSGKVSIVSIVNNDNMIIVTNTSGLIEGMVIDFRDQMGEIISGIGEREVVFVDRLNNMIKVNGSTIGFDDVSIGSIITVHGSYQNEITGLAAIFDDNVDTLYGVSKSANPWIKPYIQSSVGTLTEAKLQKAIDNLENIGGNTPDVIVTGFGVRRAIVSLLSTNRRSLDTLDIAGGFKSVSFNGIPVIADRFCPRNTIYILNSKDFALHQLCDWQWLSGDDGKVLRQIPGKPVYTATLVKYAELMCSRPYAQAMLKGVTEA